MFGLLHHYYLIEAPKIKVFLRIGSSIYFIFIFRLTIRNITKKMSGQYVCGANNVEGSGYSNGLKISINYKPGMYFLNNFFREIQNFIISLRQIKIYCIYLFIFFQFVQHQPFKVKTLESILFVLWIQNPWLALIDGYLTVRKPLLKFQVLKVPCFSVITNLQLTKAMDKFYAGHQIILVNKNLLVFFMLFLWDLLHHQKNAKYENNFFKGIFF